MAVVGAVKMYISMGESMSVQFEEIEGNGIDEVGPKLLEVARTKGCVVATTIFGIPIVVHPEESVDTLKTAYYALLRDRHDDQQPAERRVRIRRHTLHEESPGRRKTDYTIPIQLHSELPSEPST